MAKLRGLAAVLLVAVAAITLSLSIGCGKRAAGPVQIQHPANQLPAAGDEAQARSNGELPGVWELDALCGAKSVREGATVVSLGADFTEEESGTTCGVEYAIEASGTAPE